MSIAKRFSTLALMALAMCGAAMAGTTDTEFQAIFNKIIGWAGGYAGKSLAVVSLIVGIMAGLGRSNFIPVVAGAGFALALGFGPGILAGIVTAVI
jgi:conjugal transfer pilus assembly protein TraA